MSALAVAHSLRGKETMADANRSRSSPPNRQSLRTAHRMRRSQRALKRVSSMDAESGSGDMDEIEGPDCVTRMKRLQLLLVKYTFVCVNMASIAISAYVLFIADHSPSLWIPRNSLTILGLIFGMILSVIAIRGGMKEELYLVLTYSVIIVIVFVLCLVSGMLTALFSLLISGAYVSVCLYFSLLLYLKPPKAVLPTDLMSDQRTMATKAAMLRHSESRKMRESSLPFHSNHSSVRGKGSPSASRLTRDLSSHFSPLPPPTEQDRVQSIARKKQVLEQRSLTSSSATDPLTLPSQ